MSKQYNLEEETAKSARAVESLDKLARGELDPSEILELKVKKHFRQFEREVLEQVSKVPFNIVDAKVVRDLLKTSTKKRLRFRGNFKVWLYRDIDPFVCYAYSFYVYALERAGIRLETRIDLRQLATAPDLAIELGELSFSTGNSSTPSGGSLYT